MLTKLLGLAPGETDFLRYTFYRAHVTEQVAKRREKVSDLRSEKSERKDEHDDVVVSTKKLTQSRIPGL